MANADADFSSEAATDVAIANGDGPKITSVPPTDIDPVETREWLDSLEYVLNTKGPERGKQLLAVLDRNAAGRPGPWTSFARMPTLRTPKLGSGLDFGIPQLTPQAWFSASSLDETASFRIDATFAPQNKSRVEQAAGEELARALADGFAAAEVEAGKKSLLDARQIGRAHV